MNLRGIFENLVVIFRKQREGVERIYSYFLGFQFGKQGDNKVFNKVENVGIIVVWGEGLSCNLI